MRLALLAAACASARALSHAPSSRAHSSLKGVCRVEAGRGWVACADGARPLLLRSLSLVAAPRVRLRSPEMKEEAISAAAKPFVMPKRNWEE